MPTIKDDVQRDHLQRFPQERRFLSAFLNNFDVTWAKRRRSHNTELSIYFLSPERAIREQFGIDLEILLAYADYTTIEPRTMQAIEQVIQDDPARGRVEQTALFLISEDPNIRSWMDNYISMNPQSRAPIVFGANELVSNKSDPWYIRANMMRQLYSRDLFKEKLPITNDLFFFGRDNIFAEFASAIRQSENRGLFGLRKTGKTSVLFKIKRVAEQDGSSVLYYDCKLPSLRMLHWEELMMRIIRDIESLDSKQGEFSGRVGKSHVSDVFIDAIRFASKKRKIGLIFDEVEWISHLAVLDKHWHIEFIPFWQTMWNAQSEVRSLSLVIAGVNPKIVEDDTIQGVQNPIFGIISPYYLRGFSKSEIRVMLRHLGRRMGILFQEDAIDELHKLYGGHPLLTRIACSYINTLVGDSGSDRPVSITAPIVARQDDARDRELQVYCKHIVSELKMFYPDEYYVLETLASGNVATFMELSSDNEYTAHLREYGLLDERFRGRPQMAIPVLGKYVNSERMKLNKETQELYLVPVTHRENWLRGRKKKITDELRQICKLSRRDGRLPLYSEIGFPEAERFMGISTVGNQDEFSSFINIMNRCFVEALGKKLDGAKFIFSQKFSEEYPDLKLALDRIRLYRNDALHIFLTHQVDADLDRQLRHDLMGKKLSDIADPYFVLQQIVIDELYTAIIIELDRIS